MTATGPEPPNPVATTEDHAYFQSIEAAFLRLRGKASLLSATDWQVAQGWHRAGVPIEVVVSVMEELFARARLRRKRTISALSYFQAAVQAAWEEVSALSAGSRKERLEPLAVEPRLERLAAAIGTAVPEAGRFREAIAAVAGLAGGVPEVESALAALDRELLETLARALPHAAAAELAAEQERALDALRVRLPEAELEEARLHLRSRLLRQRFGVPVLSLFAPEAREPREDAAS